MKLWQAEQMERQKRSRDLVNIMAGGDVIKKKALRSLDVFEFFWELWEFERNNVDKLKSHQNGS